MIEETIAAYFEGYQKADVTLIKKAFHEDVKLLSSDAGKLSITDMQSWLKNLEERKERNDIRKGTLAIESVDVTDSCAAVRLKIRFPEFSFTDYLSLLKLGEEWKIVGKIYHFEKL